MVQIRYAKKEDVGGITLLMSELGYEAAESEVKYRLSKLDKNPDYHTIVT